MNIYPCRWAKEDIRQVLKKEAEKGHVKDGLVWTGLGDLGCTPTAEFPQCPLGVVVSVAALGHMAGLQLYGGLNIP